MNLIPFYSNERIYREYLCLNGTVICQYKGNKYNIPIEINLHQNHPFQSPTAKVKPTSNMYIANTNQDVQQDGTVNNLYLRSWRHVNYLTLAFKTNFKIEFLCTENVKLKIFVVWIELKVLL